MNSKLAKRIQEMFRVSEIITVNEEAITPNIQGKGECGEIFNQRR